MSVVRVVTKLAIRLGVLVIVALAAMTVPAMAQQTSVTLDLRDEPGTPAKATATAPPVLFPRETSQAAQVRAPLTPEIDVRPVAAHTDAKRFGLLLLAFGALAGFALPLPRKRRVLA